MGGFLTVSETSSSATGSSGSDWTTDASTGGSEFSTDVSDGQRAKEATEGGVIIKTPECLKALCESTGQEGR